MHGGSLGPKTIARFTSALLEDKVGQQGSFAAQIPPYPA
jgi:hypothetical protein